MYAYAMRIGAHHLCVTRPKLYIKPKDNQRSENALRLGYLPIFEKEQGFSYLGEYDQVAIVDADVYARTNAPDIFEATGDADFAGVCERDLPLLPHYAKKVHNYAKDQYGDSAFRFFNMGVTVWNKSMLRFMDGQAPKEFIERPEFEKFVNGEGKYRWSTDQTLLNTWVKQTGMSTATLDWRWNCLHDYVRYDALKHAHLLHFNLASKMPRGGAEIPDIIKGLA